MVKVAVRVLVESWQREAAEIAKLNLSALLRQAIDTALDCHDEIENQEAELQNKKAALRLEEMLIAEKKKQKQTQDNENKIKENAMIWIKEHPKYVSGYQKGIISIPAWRTVIKETGVKNKKAAEKLFDEYIRTGQNNGGKEVSA